LEQAGAELQEALTSKQEAMKSSPKENADLQAALEENKQNLIAMPR
jgi:hypothetical protein